MRVIFVHLIATVIASVGNKRTRDEFENPLSTIPYRVEIANMIDTLAGQSGSKIDIVRRMPEDDPAREILLSISRLEVSAFDIITKNPSLNPRELVNLLNSKIRPSDRIFPTPYHVLPVSFWVRILTQLEGENYAEMIKQETKIQTSENGVLYLEISDKLWNRVIFEALTHQGPRDILQASMPSLQVPRTIPEFASLLPPIAREYIHQKLRSIALHDDKKLIRPLVDFDSRSVLFRNMREYLLTLASLGTIDRIIVPVIQAASPSETTDALVQRINSQFSLIHPPHLNLFYTVDKIKNWRTLVHLTSFDSFVDSSNRRGAPLVLNSNTFDQLVLSPLKIADQPTQITSEQVRIEWEKYQRKQAISGIVYSGINTEIVEKQFDPDFHLVSPSDISNYPSSLFPDLSDDAKRAVLKLFFNDTSPDTDESSHVRSRVRIMAIEMDLDADRLVEFATQLVKTRVMHEDFVEELFRINKMRIRKDPATILQDAKARGIYTRLTSEDITIFYSILAESIRQEPEKLPVYPRAEKKNWYILHKRVWKTYFLLPLLNNLSS